MNRRRSDWQLPPGVDRGLWDYLNSTEMVSGYDEMLRGSALAEQDLAFCLKHFSTPGRVIDLGCGTGRLACHLARLGFDSVGVDLSPMMLQAAREKANRLGVAVAWAEGNLLRLSQFLDSEFDYAACLFSTLGMIRGSEHRRQAMCEFARILKSGGLLALHIHRRWYRGLGSQQLLQQFWKTVIQSRTAGDITMSQHYGGASLTLHHFTWSETLSLLRQAGFEFVLSEPVLVGQSVYGHLILARRISDY